LKIIDNRKNTMNMTPQRTIISPAYLVPADALLPGVTIHLKARGRYRAVGSPGLTIRLHLGDSLMLTPIILAACNTVDQPWQLDARLICTAAGINGEVEGEARSRTHVTTPQDSEHPSAKFTTEWTDPNPAVNTTEPQTLRLSTEWSAASPLNVVTLDEFDVEVRPA
jgi:hypothetical protein